MGRTCDDEVGGVVWALGLWLDMSVMALVAKGPRVRPKGELLVY